MARAHEHLASARYAEAAGAFRAVLRIDPNEFQAHFGLADALVARGQRAEAVEGLVAAAESCTAREDHGAALTLYGKALAVDPMRLELHLDVAMAEAALGRMESAQQRLEHLAEVYMQAGRTDEAAEVYRCLAGWEGDGEEEQDAEPEPAPARTTQVPTAAGHTAPHAAVPTMMLSTETVVIPTILVTPDGQLLEVPAEHQPGQPLARQSGDSAPLSAELLEIVHSAPIDLAAGEEMMDVERTVVAFPPPPPSLPEGYESAAHTVNRTQLEAAVVAALDNLAQLEEEDMTLIMQRLPPQPKGGGARQRSITGESRLPEFVTRGRMARPQLPPPEPEPELAVGEDLEPDDDLAADDFADDVGAEPVAEEPAPESKLRIKPAPRPVGKAAAPAPVAGGAKPAAGKPGAVAGKASAPLGAGKAAAPVGKASAPGKAAAAPVGKASAPVRPAAAPVGKASAPSKAAAPVSKASAPSKPAAAPVSKASASSKPAAPASKPSTAVKPSPVAAKPTPAGKPNPAPAAAGARPSPAPAARSTPAPGAARPAVGGAAGGNAAASAGVSAATKPTRPDNPLAERLRRRAGLHKPDAAPGRPSEAQSRPTEPISVRSPSRLPPVTKKK